jgi:hypothetical protein
MTLPEKLRYHHVHPAKLATDVVSAIVAAVLLWHQHLLRAIAIGLAPPIIVSFLVIRFANVETLTQTPLGRYVGRHMPMAMEVIKLAGVFIFWGAAWYRSIFYCSVGLLVIAFAWARGILQGSGRIAPASESPLRTRNRD